MGQRRRDGAFEGIEPDICRAIAITIFGAPKVHFLVQDNVKAFLSGDADIAIRRLTWTFARDVGRGLRFGPVILHDGQTFLVRRGGAVANVADLAGKRICVSTDANFVVTLLRDFARRKMAVHLEIEPTRMAAMDKFLGGGCDAVSADASELASALNAIGTRAGAYQILPVRISQEPLAPMICRGDDAFLDIVNWSIFALIAAAELGIDQSNILQKRQSADPLLRVFFTPGSAKNFTQDWPFHIVSLLGNYDTLYARHLGRQSPANLAPGDNAVRAAGGMLFAPPFR